MDKEIADRFANLESKIKFLEEKSESSFDIHRSIIKINDFTNQQIADLQTAMHQMRDVYYAVFPDRLKQDAQVARQVLKLTGKDVSGADPKDA